MHLLMLYVVDLLVQTIYEKEHVEPSLETKLCLRNFLFVELM